MEIDTLFMGRQPILDQDQNIVAYELLFRSAHSLHANVTNELQASAHVIVHALSNFGFQEVVGNHKGFINVNREIFMSDALELLPKEQVVIELLESIEPSEEIVNRCNYLKGLGFSLAIDDNLYDPVYEPLYEIVDIIKVDLLLNPDIDLAAMVQQFRRWPLTLLAEKVETHEMFVKCRDLGFSLFQGYYFAKPVVIQQKKIDVATMSLMHLMDQVMKEVETEEIVETFKQNPEMVYNILRLVNSIFYGIREKITAIQHAIAILGRDQLKRWVMLALYAGGDKSHGGIPLMELAAVRGRFMELLVSSNTTLRNDKELADRCFLTGVLSLVDALFQIPMEDAISQCNLTDDVKEALLERDGILGKMLKLSEEMETAEYGEVIPLISELRLSNQELASARLNAVKWATTLTMQHEGDT